MLLLIADWVTYNLLGLEQGSKIASSIDYFIYDSVKILLILFFIIAALGFLRTYLPLEKIKNSLSGRKSIIGYAVAALLGAITPFCSCSSIPIFFSMLALRIPLGISFTFLVTSPMINEYLAALMIGFFGWKITAAYISGGMLLGIFSGIALGRLNLEKYIAKDIKLEKAESKEKHSLRSRVMFGFKEARIMLKSTWLWILAGVAIGAMIHNFIPEHIVNSAISSTGIFAVPIATLIGIPIYGSCAAILPIAFALFQKGFPIGTALAFIMSVSALSLPSAVILRRAMKLKLILIFFAVVAAGIIITGYLFNALQPLLVQQLA